MSVMRNHPMKTKLSKRKLANWLRAKNNLKLWQSFALIIEIQVETSPNGARACKAALNELIDGPINLISNQIDKQLD